MSEAEDRDNVRELPEEEVDVDLDSMETAAAGKPTTVKLDGVIIHIQHAGDWSASAMRAAASADWDSWARAVIDDDTEYQVWEDADLTNNQVEAVFIQCGRSARMSAGKSARRSGQRRSTLRK
jgi:hypothetical protein